MTAQSALSMAAWPERARSLFPGVLACGVVAAAATFLSQHYGAPVATSFSALVLLAGAIWVSYRLRVLAAREGARPPEPPAVEKIG